MKGIRVRSSSRREAGWRGAPGALALLLPLMLLLMPERSTAQTVAGTVVGTHERYPLPAAEVQITGLQQNPGY